MLLQELRDLVSEHKTPEKIMEDPIMQVESLASSEDMEGRGDPQGSKPPPSEDIYERMNIPRLPILPEVTQHNNTSNNTSK